MHPNADTFELELLTMSCSHTKNHDDISDNSRVIALTNRHTRALDTNEKNTTFATWVVNISDAQRRPWSLFTFVSWLQLKTNYYYAILNTYISEKYPVFILDVTRTKAPPKPHPALFNVHV